MNPLAFIEFADLFSDLTISAEAIATIRQTVSVSGLDVSAQAVAYNITHPDYQTIAGRLMHMHIRSQIIEPYSQALLNPAFDKIIDPSLVKFVLQNRDFIDGIVAADKHSHLRYDWIAVQSLKKGYLKSYITDSGVQIALEDARYAIMRMAVHLFKDTKYALRDIARFYDYVSNGVITAASPTWFHAGTKHPQMKSCFLTRIDDNIESILQGYYDTGLISKEGGGNGVHIGALRHSKVRETGKSGGVIPWMRMWNEQAKAIDQGGNRKGAFTFYLPCWHVNIREFVDLRLPEGDNDIRTRNLNICVWTSDLFFKRVLRGQKWSLFDPREAPGLDQCNGDEFERLYTRYEESGVNKIVIEAKHLMAQILGNIIISGEPFCMSADAANACSNQKHIGNHTGSNLCTEIIEQTSKDEIATCTLGNVNLSKFVREDPNRVWFDFEALGDATRFLVRILTRVTETNFAPVDRIKTSDNRHNPIGIGTLDFATVLHKFDMAWVNEDGTPSEEALSLKEKIWACKYYNSLKESNLMAIENGKPYQTFRGSPISNGKFQFDLWRERHEKLKLEGLPDSITKVTERPIVEPSAWGDDGSWVELMSKINTYGIAHSLLNSDQPTATQSVLQGGVESFQPIQFVLSTKSLLAGDMIIWCRPFVKDLEKLGLFGSDVIAFLKRSDGSAAGLTSKLRTVQPEMSAETVQRLTFLERKYATAYEIPMMTQSDFSTVSSRYVCQSSSFNFHIPKPTINDLFNNIIYRWCSGHKTLMYYGRFNPAVNPVKYTVREKQFGKSKTIQCTEEVCTMCE